MKRFKGPTIETPTTKVTAQLLPEQVAALDAIGRPIQRSRAYMFREAVAFYLRENSTAADIILSHTDMPEAA